MAVTFIAKDFCGLTHRNPKNAVMRLLNLPFFPNWSAEINMADLPRPHVIIGHKTIALERSQAPFDLYHPTGLFAHLTMKRLKWRLASINSATGELKLRLRQGLKCYQQLPASAQQAIRPRSRPVFDVFSYRFAKSPDHEVQFSILEG